MTEIEQVLPVQNQLGEGPLWNLDEQALYWVDIEGHSFHRYFPDTGTHESYSVGQPIGCLAFRSSGGLIMAVQDGIGFWDITLKAFQLAVNPEEGRENARFNDGKVDKSGRFWAGTIGEDQESNLFRIDPDGSVSTMETGISISNGIGWSPDDKTMYYTDSPLRVIYAYDFDPKSGSITNRRPFIQVPPEQGVPDGLTVDQEGFIWSAHWDGWRITRYDPEGIVERVIALPVQRPTSCTFGGSELNQLYITSAWTGLDEVDRRKQPLAGNLLRIQTEFTGQQANLFQG
ncbi:MAG: SMP-30/gluconolactonase/LRE family protein [Anaerolineales bacterium]|nr:SMP-30/gluconolactonase/LRE family protein [Anaerolineales bacterium]